MSKLGKVILVRQLVAIWLVLYKFVKKLYFGAIVLFFLG